MRIPKVSLTSKIFIGLFLGILIGWMFPNWGLAARPLSNLFLNLIKSIIAPLIFATLVVGISGTGDIKQVGRIGAKAFVYFEVVTTLALFIGLFAVNIAQPGKGLSLSNIQKSENKSELSERALGLSKEAVEATKKAETLIIDGNASEVAQQSSLAVIRIIEASQVLAKGLTAAEPPSKAQSFGDIIAALGGSRLTCQILQKVQYLVQRLLRISKEHPIVRFVE